MKNLVFGFILLLLASQAGLQADIPFPGTKQDFYGFECYRLPGGGDIKPYYVVIPKQAAPSKPWIWSGAFWGDKMTPPTEQVVRANLKLVEQGFHLVCSSPASVYGYLEGNKCMDGVYAEMADKYGLAKKPAMVGISRETLFMYRWASADSIIPHEENAAIVKERYEKMGDPILVILKSGAGHHPHGLEDTTPILDFIRKHTETLSATNA